MKQHVASHSFGDSLPERELEFIHQVNPDADPTGVLLFRNLMRAHRLLTQAAEQRLRSAGLSWAKLRLLAELWRAESQGATEGMQPSELSALQGIQRNTGSALIAGLEKEGLISRALHSVDRRKFMIRLTPEGRRLVKSRLADQLDFTDECFGMLTGQERETLMNVLIKLNQNLTEQEQADGESRSRHTVRNAHKERTR